MVIIFLLKHKKYNYANLENVKALNELRWWVKQENSWMRPNLICIWKWIQLKKNEIIQLKLETQPTDLKEKREWTKMKVSEELVAPPVISITKEHWQREKKDRIVAWLIGFVQKGWIFVTWLKCVSFLRWLHSYKEVWLQWNVPSWIQGCNSETPHYLGSLYHILRRWRAPHFKL